MASLWLLPSKALGLTAVSIFVAVVFIGLPTTFAQQQLPIEVPTINCAQPSSEAEITICGSPMLRSMDAKLNDIYRDTISRFGINLGPDEKSKQFAWLAKRDSCRDDHACLQEVYGQRIADLTALTAPLSGSVPARHQKSGANDIIRLNAADKRLIEEVEKYSSECRSNGIYAQFRDCECLADAYRQERIKQGWSANSGSIRMAIKDMCVNKASTKRYLYNNCIGIHNEYKQDNRLRCLCYADRFSTEYEKNPNDSSQYQIYEGSNIYSSCKTEIKNGAYTKPFNFDSIVADLAAPYPDINKFADLQPTSQKEELDATWLNLQMLSRHPESLSDDALTRQLPYLVKSEQERRKAIDDFLSIRSSIRTAGLDPFHPSFVFDWQSEVSRRPNFAAGPLIDIFRNRPQNWSFLKGEKDFDRRFNHVVDVFIFSADSVTGRESQFVSRELVPVFRQFLDAIIKRTAPIASIEVQLPSAVYDFQSGNLVFGKGTVLQMSRPDFVSHNNQSLAIYATFGSSDATNWPWKTPSALRGAIGLSNTRPTGWVSIIRPDNPIRLALTRRLVFPNLRLDASKAETVVSAAPAGDGYVARVTVQARDAFQMLDSRKTVGVVLADLVGVEILQKDGTILARLKPDDFPLEDEVQTARARAEATQRAAEAEEKRALAAKVESDKQAAERVQDAANAAREQKVLQKQVRPMGSFGPEVTSLRLGMTTDEADSIIRKQITVVAVLELKEGTWGYSPTLLQRRVYVSNKGNDIFTVYTVPQAENRVVGISRRLALPLPLLTEQEASKLLTDKFGTPSASGLGGMYWADDVEALGPPSSPCRNIQDDIQTRGYVYTEGKLDTMRLYGVASRGADNSLSPDEIGTRAGQMLRSLMNSVTDVTNVRSCPTTLYGRVSLNPIDPTLSLAIVDGGWVASLLERDRSTKSKANVEAIKSLLDGAH